MTEQEYIKSLESLLIFMCKSNEDIWESLMDLGKQGNDTWTQIPMIQGNLNFVVGRLARLDFNKSKVINAMGVVYKLEDSYFFGE